MAPVREKQLQKRKQETLETAGRLLMERGYADLNMDELADEVGISKPTLYQYFNSKDELVAQALVHMISKMEDYFAEPSDKSPLEQLEQFLRSMLKARQERRNALGQMDFEVMRSILQRHPYAKERLTQTKSRLGQVVKNAQDLGEIDPALPPWVVVGLMFSLQGIIVRALMQDEPQRSDEEILEAIESIVRIFRRSVSVPVLESG